MTDLQVFKNSKFGEIQTIQINNSPWFLAKDICSILGLKNPTVSLQALDIDEVTKLNLGSLQGDTNFVSESGLYTLIIRSRKPIAKPFRKWVTQEVLPQIRLTGGYIPITETDTDKEILAKAFMISKNTIEQKDNLIAELEPKAQSFDRFLKTKGYVSLNEVAKSLGKGRNKMLLFLRENKILFKDNCDNIAYQRFCNSGLFTVNYSLGNDGLLHAVTKVSTKGIKYIHNLYLKQEVTC